MSATNLISNVQILLRYAAVSLVLLTAILVMVSSVTVTSVHAASVIRSSAYTVKDDPGPPDAETGLPDNLTNPAPVPGYWWVVWVTPAGGYVNAYQTCKSENGWLYELATYCPNLDPYGNAPCEGLTATYMKVGCTG